MVVEVDTRKATALVAYLAVTGEAHGREALATLLWPEYEQDRAYANLRRTLWALNKVLSAEWLTADRETVGLTRGPGFGLDVDAFRGYLAECERHTRGSRSAPDDPGTRAACVPPLTSAVDLYRGDFLEGFTLRDSPDFDTWQFFEAQKLRREVSSALETLVACLAAQGEFDAAAGYGRRWVAADSLHEPAHRALMRVYASSGQRAEALRQYHECARILQDEVGAEPSVETTALYEAIRAGDVLPSPSQPSSPTKVGEEGATPVPGSPRAQAPRHNLPVQTTSFVGREETLAEIADLLRNPNCRLLTLIGPGGVGKTRLAIRAATMHLDAFPHGVFFVPLAPVDSAEYIVPAVADALDFPFFQREGEEPRQQLLNYLREKRMLLVLDNLEHLIDGVGLLADILRAGSELKLLATSRQRLNLQGEWVLEVPGLRFALDGRLTSGEKLSAAQLFVQRAGQVNVGFAPTADDMRHVARVCRLVEGVPLAIELAAAWVNVLSPREIADEIERSLDFLATSMHDVPDRHRSLRAVFDHSWELLSEAERHVLQRLSVFRGGFQRRAAQVVAGAGLPLLSGLVDKSLLHRESSGRYAMHEVVCQYAAEMLEGDADAARDVRDRHCSYYATLLEARYSDLIGPRQADVLEEIGAEIENVRRAWDWAIAHVKLGAIDQAAHSLRRFYMVRSLFGQGEEAFRRAAAALDAASQEAAIDGRPAGHDDLKRVLGLVLAFQADFTDWVYRHDEADRIIQRSLHILETAEAPYEHALAASAAVLMWAVEDDVEAEQLLRDAISTFEAHGDRVGVALALQSMSNVAAQDHAEAKAYLEESLAITEEIGDRYSTAYTLFELGRLAQLVEVDRQMARAYYQRSLDIRRELNDPWGVSFCLDSIGYAQRELGNYAAARELHLESLAISREIGDGLGIAGSLDNLGLVARDEGQAGGAARYVREGLALRREVGRPWDIAISERHLGDVAMLEGDHTEAWRWYAQSVATFESINWRTTMEDSLRGLGEALTELGEHEQARRTLRSALDLAMFAGTVSSALDSLVAAARLLMKLDHPVAAVELLAFALDHHAANYQTRLEAEVLFQQLEPALTPDTVSTARRRARTKTLEQIADEVLFEKVAQGG